MSDNYIRQYHDQIKSGEIVVGKWIKLLFEIIEKGLEEEKFFYDSKKANRAITFIESFLHHAKGSLAPQLIKLELWQKAIISLIFGIVDDKNYRQFREILIVVGRKCGKSLLASGIMEYVAYLDDGYGNDIYCLAPKLDQADIVFSSFWQSVQKEPELLALTKKRKTDIYISQTNTSVTKLAFNDKTADGFNPQLTVCDEIAAWPAAKGLKQYEVMASALGAREEPLILSITTANYINDGIYDELMKRATRFLLGDSKEKRLLPILYIIDDIEKWNDINELRKSLPNLGVSVSEDFIKEEIVKAMGSLSKKAEFICKYCNIKQSSSSAWLNAIDVKKNVSDHELSLEDFRGCYCVGGIDLSKTTDLTSSCIVIEKNEVLYLFAKFWMPSEKVEYMIAREGVPYDIFIQRGLLNRSGKNFVDYRDCFNWFKSLVTDYEIYPLKIGYDRYSAQQLIQSMDEFGFHMDDVNQGFNLSSVIRETEGLIKNGDFNIGNNDLMKAHLLNVALKSDNEIGKVKAIKIEERAHIDGCAALLDAMTVRQKYYKEIGGQLKNCS